MALSIGKAWDEARAALSANQRLIWPVALGLVLVPAVISTMVQPPAAPGEQPAPGAWMWVTLVMIFVMLAGQMAIALLSDGWRGSVSEAIGRAVRRLPTLFLAVIMLMLPLLVIISVLLAVAGMGSAEAGFKVQDISATGWLVLLIGFIALLVVGVRLAPLVVIVAREDVGPVEALKRCFRLTSGHFWKLLGFILLASIAFLVVAGAAGAVIGSIVSLLFGRPDPWSVSMLLVALTAALIQMAFVTIYTVILTQITRQLRAEDGA